MPAWWLATLLAFTACQGGGKLLINDIASGAGGASTSGATNTQSGGGAGACPVLRCGTECVDTGTDPANCGACGEACPSGEACEAGQCALACAGGTTKCSGPMGETCADTSVDPANCGACGKACGVAELCDAGVCVTACGGTTACGQSCVDLAHDPNHCGGCGKACPAAPNAKAYCVDGLCGSACTSGFGDCNALSADGCEKGLSTVMDCGQCGKACELLNATAACVNGACVVKTCTVNFGDCDKDGKSCETNFASDPKNCGGCGQKCAATEVCANLKCQQIGCQNGAVELSVSPGGNMKVCDDPLDKTCEQDVETLCPTGWQLCSSEQFLNRNAGWTYAINGNTVVVAEIYCRNGGGAGHYTLGPYGGNVLGDAVPFNCGYGSSRESCLTGYGCNELQVQALCCAPTPSCGNGVIDSVEEGCDDKNLLETDDCLNNCTRRKPPACN